MDGQTLVALAASAVIVSLAVAVVRWRRSGARALSSASYHKSPVPTVILETQRVTARNAAAVRLFGDSDIALSRFIIPSRASGSIPASAVIEEAVRNGQEWTGPLIDPHMEPARVFEGHLIPLRPGRSALLQLLIAASDGTDLRTASLPMDGALALLAGSTDSIVVLHGDRVLYANATAAQLFGYDRPEELASVDFLASMVSSSRPVFGGGVLEREPGTVVLSHADIRGHTRTGRLLDLDVNARIITWNGVKALEVFLRDVTERKSLEREQALWRWEQEALSEIDRKIVGVADADTVFASILQHAVSLVHGDWAGLLTLDEDHSRAVWRMMHGAMAVAESEIVMDEAFRGIIIRQDQMAVEPGAEQITPLLKDLHVREQLRTSVWSPLRIGAELIGSLAVGFRSRREPGQRELRLLVSLAEKSAIALMNIRQYERVVAREQELERLSISRVEAQEEERRRIAKEIHDGIGQMLTAIKFNLEILEDSVASIGDARERITEMKNLLDGLMREARQMSYTLMPSVLDDFGLAPALQMLCEQFRKKHAIVTTFQNHGLTSRLHRLLEVSLYRIVQEALTNVLRHAAADTVTVQIIKRADRIRLIIEDNGKGMPSSSSVGHGLGFVSMRERASQFGGTLRVDSSPGEGTVVSVDVPTADLEPK